MATTQHSGFVELIVRPVRRGRPRREVVSVRLHGGHILRLEGRVDAKVVRALLAAVVDLPC